MNPTQKPIYDQKPETARQFDYDRKKKLPQILSNQVQKIKQQNRTFCLHKICDKISINLDTDLEKIVEMFRINFDR